jgi:hypothetical protein
MAKFITDGKSESDDANAKKYADGQSWVFKVTFVNYAMAHWTRKLVLSLKI